MPALIPTFQYDIFISYRHNDNLPSSDSGRQASDGWVSDFVQNLEKELRGTIKAPLSIYFDRNPHDGLLETYHVDKSLEGKLKCLTCLPAGRSSSPSFRKPIAIQNHLRSQL